jgi:hypothetical protein
MPMVRPDDLSDIADLDGLRDFLVTHDGRPETRAERAHRHRCPN